MTDTATNRREIDAYAVVLDETNLYTIDPADAPYIARIRGVYLFDRNERTHCCELTPSYYLIHLYDQVIPTDAGEALDDADREALYEKYEHNGGEDCYVHCGEIERIIDAGQPGRIVHYGDCAPNDLCDEIEDADERHSAEMEEIAEDMQGNCPF